MLFFQVHDSILGRNWNMFKKTNQFSYTSSPSLSETLCFSSCLFKAAPPHPNA